MSVLTLIEDLRRRGVELAAKGDRLSCRAPRGVLSPELLDDLRSHKTEILAGLSTPFAKLESDWAAAWGRAQDGFAVHGISPTHETREAAIVLEMWVAYGGSPMPGVSIEDLQIWAREIYRGRDSARISADGRVVLRAVRNNEQGEPK